MRQVCLLLTALLCAAAPAQAQVTVDLQALDALPGAKPAGQASARAEAQAAADAQGDGGRQAAQAAAAADGREARGRAAGGHRIAAARRPSTPQPPPATLPTAPPATVALAPVPPPPQPRSRRHRHRRRRSPTAPPARRRPTGAGLRVTFGAGQADLSPASAAAIKSIVQTAPAGDSTSFNVVGLCRGHAGRSLDRPAAFAVARPRGAQRADGRRRRLVPHLRARARRHGGDEAPDRVDLAVHGRQRTGSVARQCERAGCRRQEPTP